MSRAKLLADLQTATTDLAAARRALADAHFNARHGLAHNLMFATSREHVSFHRWLRAHEAFAASAPQPFKAPATSAKIGQVAAASSSVTPAAPRAEKPSALNDDLKRHMPDWRDRIAFRLSTRTKAD